MYRGWTQRDYQNKHYNINQKDEGTLHDRGRDGGTNFILRIKEEETRLTLQEHDDDELYMFRTVSLSIIRSFSLYTQQWYMSYRFADSLRVGCQQTCMTYTIAVCTVKNS